MLNFLKSITIVKCYEIQTNDGFSSLKSLCKHNPSLFHQSQLLAQIKLFYIKLF